MNLSQLVDTISRYTVTGAGAIALMFVMLHVWGGFSPVLALRGIWILLAACFAWVDLALTPMATSARGVVILFQLQHLVAYAMLWFIQKDIFTLFGLKSPKRDKFYLVTLILLGVAVFLPGAFIENEKNFLWPANGLPYYLTVPIFFALGLYPVGFLYWRTYKGKAPREAFYLCLGSTILLAGGIVDQIQLLIHGNAGFTYFSATGIGVSAFTVIGNGLLFREAMEQTAARSRMESELAMAKLVQNRFFPQQPLIQENVTLAGRSLSPSQVSGDWWHYGRIGKYLVFIIADVMGHGASAALLTAASHTAWSLFIREYEDKKDSKPDIGTLAREFNAAIFDSSHGELSMTGFLGLIDTETGSMEYINASHVHPYAFRRSSKHPVSIQQQPQMAFGGVRSREYSVDIFNLQPGDKLLLTTDGVWEAANSEGVVRRKKEILVSMAKHVDSSSTDSNQTIDYILRDMHQWIDKPVSEFSDDITLLMCSVPENAKFSGSA